MKKWVLVGLLVITSYGMAYGSSWSVSIGGILYDYASTVQQTTDGGYIVAGYSNTYSSGPDFNGWVVKLNADRSVAWQKRYGGLNDEFINSIQQTADGGYIAAGHAYSSGLEKLWVLKLKTDGAVDWQKTYGGSGTDHASSIRQTADGGYIVAGFTDSFGAGSSDAWVLKLDGSGGIVWEKTYGGSGADYANTIRQTAEGGYILAGYTSSFGTPGGSLDFWVLKLDDAGGVTWQKTYGGTSDDQANSIEQTADGGYIVGGSTASFGVGGDAWVLKLNGDGSVAWQKTYGGSGAEQANSVQQTADGGYIVAGYTTSFGVGQDAWVLKLTGDGSVTWQKSYGGTGVDQANSIQQTIDGGYLVGGLTFSFGASGDAWVLKLDPNGDINGCSAVAIVASTASPSDTAAPAVDSLPTVKTNAATVSIPTIATIDIVASPVTNCSFTPSASKWQKTYGGTGFDLATSVQQISDGYIVAGYTHSFGAGFEDVWVLKLADDGSISWQKTYGGAYSDDANAIQQTTDGGFVVAGYTVPSPGTTHAFVLKLDASGSVAWQKTYGISVQDVANSVQQTTDGGYIVAGYTFGVAGYEAWVLKLDSSGGIVWNKTYGGSGHDFAYSVQQTAEGGYIVAGYTNSFGAGGYKAWVLKLDSSGGIVWNKTYSGSGNDYAYAIRQTGDGGYVLAAYTSSFGVGGFDTWILKLNSDGSVAWQKTYGGSGTDIPASIQQTSDGGYILAGSTQSAGAGGFDAWLLKLNADGSVAWQKTYGGSNDDYANSVRQTTDGGYIVAGGTSSFGAGDRDAWIMKLDQNGDLSGCSTVKSSLPTVQTVTGAANAPVATTSSPSVTVSSPAFSTNNNITETPVETCATKTYSQYLLELLMGGWGTGNVTSSPFGIDCNTDCSSPFNDSVPVTLTATPDSLGEFLGWSGACDSSGNVTMDADKTCIATFATSADFFADKLSGYLPLVVNFTDNSGNSPTLWSWDFGDSGTDSIQNPSHIYGQPGLYTVSLTATGSGGAATARKLDYITVWPCPNGPARIDGPAYYESIESAYGALGASGSFDLQAIKFNEDVTMSSGWTVTLTGGYSCDYGSHIGHSKIRGSLTIGGAIGSVTVARITIQ